MRIAMLTSDYLPKISGITSHIESLSLALARRGDEGRGLLARPSGRATLERALYVDLKTFMPSLNLRGS